MTLEEFNSINWHRGNVVMLDNGKEYLVKGVKSHGRYLLLYSEEYDARFVVDHYIVAKRTSDYEEPEEVYLEMKRQKQLAVQERIEAERQERLRIKEERKRRNLEEQERIHREAVARKAAIRLQREKEMEEARIAGEARRAAKAAAKAAAKEAYLQAQREKALAKKKAAAESRQAPQRVTEPRQAPQRVTEPRPTVSAAAPKPTVSASPKPVAAPVEAKPADAPEAPKKRIRQRIRIATSKVEKVIFGKK